MRRTVAICALAAVCVLAAGAATARADDAVVADGVTIGPVAVGGMTLVEATDAVLRAYLSPVELRIGGAAVRVSPRRFHTIAPVADAVQSALAAAPGTAVPLRASLDLKKLAAWVAAFAKHHERKPVAARLLLRHLKPAFVKAKPGRAVKVVATRVLVRNEIRDGVRSPIAVPTRAVAPPKPEEAGSPIIVIRRGANRLTLYRGMRPVRTFPVATGQKAYPTPLGRFQIVVKWKNPTWYPPTYDDWAKDLKPVPPGPDNPLGTRWMGLSSPGVGIHGTDEPASIGYSLSHGCIRMQVPSAEWLFDHVTVGTPVFIVSK